MSKMHLKTNSVKNSLLIMIAIGMVATALHIAIAISGVISVNKNSEPVANPALVQQQTIQKAFDLLQNQTIQIDNQN